MGKYFGTDGFRGEANVTLTSEHAYKIGKFIGWYYGANKNRKARIVIGKDTRRSSYMFEAALVDGCSSRQTFWKITLPLIKPILLYNLVTSLVGGLTMFDIPHLMTQGNPDYTTNTVARFIYQQGFDSPNNFNMASAASVVLFGIIVICSLILNAIMKDREPRAARRAAK